MFPKVVSHINALYGWTGIGLLKTGLVQDSTSTGTENIDYTSNTQQPHISYLYHADLPCIVAEQEFGDSLLNV